MAKPQNTDVTKLSRREARARFESVVDHMLNTPPAAHKPLGKNAQAKRRAKEKRE
jgi:hypothetical protein